MTQSVVGASAPRTWPGWGSGALKHLLQIALRYPLNCQSPSAPHYPFAALWRFSYFRRSRAPNALDLLARYAHNRLEELIISLSAQATTKVPTLCFWWPLRAVPRPDDEIEGDVRAGLLQELLPGPSEIEVKVRDGVVCLEGSVRNEASRQRV